MIHTNSNVLLFQKILPHIASDVQRFVIHMNIFIAFCPTIVWLDHRTCLFKNFALPTRLTPKGYVSEQSHQHMEGLIFLNPWLITDPQNSLHFCQCDRQEIAPRFNLHISVTREVTVHIFFHVLYVYWVFLFLLWIICPCSSSIFLLGCLSFLKLFYGSTVCMIDVNPLL